MKSIFKIGDTKTYVKTVEETDLAAFENGVVHQVYGTFALGRDAEWACRLFVLEMKEDLEEGIGTFLTVNHHSPAILGQTVTIIATIDNLEKNSIECSYEVRVGERLIADGRQGQKIILKQRLIKLFKSLTE